MLVLLSMALVAWIRLLPQTLPDAGGRLRSELSYSGSDGREHVYLGDFDSYLWLRYARNLLRSGTPCDAVVDGECRDTYTNAPVGVRTPYARSLHVAAIAGLHPVITWFAPTYPLPASAFLVPVIVGVLGVLPAFFIARALAGTAAGVFAALLTGVHPIVLTRTVGSDNDIWQVVLPLYLLWAAMAALAARTSVRAVIWAGLAGLVLALQAWAWRGWPFIYIVVIAGLAAAAIVDGARYGIRSQTARVWLAPGLQRIALVLLVFYAVAGAGVTVAGSEEPYFTVPIKAAGALVRAVTGPPPAQDIASAWPTALSGVAELAPLRLSGIASANGGIVAFAASLVGLVLLLLAPWWSEEEPLLAHRGVAFVVVGWFLAAVVVAYEGRRLLLLLAPPFGIACAVLFGCVDAWLRRQIGAMPGGYRRIGVWLLTGVLALMLVYPLQWGFNTARRYMPLVHDAWWDTLTALRETTPRDAIVHTWWDYGHWVTYIAERRVSNDGTSLLTHIPNWVGRALMAPSEEASAGILRMLSCGSDATPLPEGAAGAYGKLRALGRDSASAYALVSELVTRDEVAADAYLTERQLTPAARADVLGSTHCNAPESYLVLNSRLVSKRRAWMSLGQWQPREDDKIAPDAMATMAEDVADALIDGDTDAAAAPFVPSWIPCEATGQDGDMTCKVGLALGHGAPVIETFTYRAASPENARLHGRVSRGGTFAGPAITGTPAVVMIARADALEEIEFPSPSQPQLAVLIDGERILVGALPLLKSTFVQLMYLDGRYTRLFTKHDEREALGERVVTWKVTHSAPDRTAAPRRP